MDKPSGHNHILLNQRMNTFLFFKTYSRTGIESLHNWKQPKLYPTASWPVGTMKVKLLIDTSSIAKINLICININVFITVT